MADSCFNHRSAVSSYLNAEGAEKFRESAWLISAILVKFNHLRASRGAGAPPAAFDFDFFYPEKTWKVEPAEEQLQHQQQRRRAGAPAPHTSLKFVLLH
jgi:hypothetical protein